jgi:hypothetical protein
MLPFFLTQHGCASHLNFETRNKIQPPEHDQIVRRTKGGGAVYKWETKKVGRDTKGKQESDNNFLKGFKD